MMSRAIAVTLLTLGGLAAPAQAAQVNELRECYASAGPAPQQRQDVRRARRAAQRADEGVLAPSAAYDENPQRFAMKSSIGIAGSVS